MNRMVVERQIDDNGILRLVLPLGSEEAGRTVRIILEPISPAKEMSPEEWRAAVLATAGGWEGDFERPPQGELEEREPLTMEQSG